MAVPYLMLQGTVCGAWVMARAALAASRALAAGGDDESFLHAKLVTGRFYFDHVAPRAAAWLATVEAGSRGIGDLASETF